MDLGAIIDAIQPSTWWWGAAIAGIALLAATFPSLKQSWLRWRRDRRIAQAGAISREEYRELSWSIEETGERVPLAGIAGGATLMWAGLVLGDLGFRDIVEAALLAWGAIGILIGVWRKFNDPPELSASDDAIVVEGNIYPREALIGVGFAVTLVGFVLVMAIFYF